MLISCFTLGVAKTVFKANKQTSDREHFIIRHLELLNHGKQESYIVTEMLKTKLWFAVFSKATILII